MCVGETVSVAGAVEEARRDKHGMAAPEVLADYLIGWLAKGPASQGK